MDIQHIAICIMAICSILARALEDLITPLHVDIDAVYRIVIWVDLNLAI